MNLDCRAGEEFAWRGGGRELCCISVCVLVYCVSVCVCVCAVCTHVNNAKHLQQVLFKEAQESD